MAYLMTPLVPQAM